MRFDRKMGNTGSCITHNAQENELINVLRFLLFHEIKTSLIDYYALCSMRYTRMSVFSALKSHIKCITTAKGRWTNKHLI